MRNTYHISNAIKFFRHWISDSGLVTFQRGFTLIELLTTIAIVGVLAVGLMTVINPLEQLAKSRDAKRKSDLAQIQKALELYYQDNGSYPTSSNDGRIQGPNGRVEWGQSGFAPYMQVLPKDPNTNKRYQYISGTQSYRIFASLDRQGKDPAACNAPANTPCTTAASANCGGVCNYAVSSPNVSPN